jgi:hypothetical protein
LLNVSIIANIHHLRDHALGSFYRFVGGFPPDVFARQGFQYFLTGLGHENSRQIIEIDKEIVPPGTLKSGQRNHLVKEKTPRSSRHAGSSISEGKLSPESPPTA